MREVGRERSDGGEGQSGGREWPFYRARKRRQVRARALPDRAGAKPRVAYLATEIIELIITLKDEESSLLTLKQ